MRAATRRWLHGAIAVAWHPAFRLPFAGLEALTGMDPRRAENVLTWALDRQIVHPPDLLDADEIPWSWAREVHDAEYLASLDRPETIASITGVDAARLSTAAVLETWRRAVGGTVAAALSAADGRSAASLLGGFHHAAPTHGAGFCGLSDVAIAIRRLRKAGFSGAITVYDLDAHPPDGLVAALAADPHVHVASIGVASEWALAAPALDIRVPRGAGDAPYLDALARMLREAPAADLAVVLAGADPLAGDRFGALACSEDGLYERDRRVLAHLRTTPVVLLPAGGYTRGAWRVFANALARLAGSRERVRRGYDPLFRKTKDIARALDPHALGAVDDDWSDIAADLHLPPPGEPRVLGLYTRQGVEYALSRYGILPALSRMGFGPLWIEIEAAALPHRMRVMATVAGRAEPLVELSVNLRDVGPWRTLFVEWLALRDPRTPFTADRPRLPGQERPGLGMAEEFGYLLLRVAERKGLAGVSFVPAHYHVAWIVRDRFVFVDPAVRGRFLAMRDALRGVPLHEASRRLDEEGLPVEYGEPVRWEPEVMVTPLDPALRQSLAEGDSRAAAARVALSERLIAL